MEQEPPINRPRYHYASIFGPEWRALLLKCMADEMAHIWAFQAGAMHHAPKAKITMELESLPFTKFTVKAECSVKTPGEAPPVDVVKGKIVIEHKVEYPNKEREQAGLPVPSAVTSSDGSVSDYPEGVDPIDAANKIVDALLVE